MDDKKAFYENLYETLQERETAYRQEYSRIATFRAVSFLVGAALLVIGFKDSVLWAVVCGFVAMAVFCFLVKRHADVDRAMQTAASKTLVVKRYTERFTDGWRMFEENGAEYLTAEDTVAQDIDLLGPNSLYQLLSVCHTENGKKKLADTMRKLPYDEKENVLRRAAIAELTEKADTFGIDYETAGAKAAAKKKRFDEAAFEAYCGDETAGRLPVYAHVASVLIPVLFFASLALCITGVFGYGLPLAVFLICLAFSWVTKTTTDKVIMPLCAVSAHLDDYLDMMNAIEQAEFSSELLGRLRDKICGDGGALYALRALKGICQAYNISFNPLIHQIFEGTFAWDYQLAHIAAAWKRKYGAQIGECFSVLGSMEELMSLAVTGVVRKTNEAVITRDDGKCRLDCEDLYHPLIAPDKVQANSAGLYCGITIITGSNMSGKTTFLRTLAVNLALAYMGAPVCAASFRASYMKLFTSMRVTDDIAHGISTFYAEIMRIKAMADYREGGQPMLCLIDEIFKGTNSADRIVGATEAIRRLAGDCCMTIVSTHDFELCEISDTNGNPAVNYHFEESYEQTEDGSRLCFDYKIKNGRCTTTNAREILRMAGFVVQ